MVKLMWMHCIQLAAFRTGFVRFSTGWLIQQVCTSISNHICVAIPAAESETEELVHPMSISGQVNCAHDAICSQYMVRHVELTAAVGFDS